MRPTAAAVLVAACLALVGCGAPDGVALPQCEFRVPDAEMVVATPGGGEPRAIPIRCWRHVSRERIELRLTPPGGPTCYRLERVELAESADAVAVTAFVSADDDPAAGACAPEPPEIATQVEFQAPLGDRRVLDGGRRD
jgi:hypothetical protein